MSSAPLPDFRLDERESPEVELTRKLLGYLLSGDLAPGQKIPPERAMAETLGVGRAAVRNSIKSLALLGLIEQRQGDGTYLASRESDFLPRVIEWGLLLGERKITDLLELRTTLEVSLAGLAAARRTEQQAIELRTLVTQMELTKDPAVYIETDVLLHLAIARASGNSAMANILSNVQSLLRVWATRVILTAGETETSLAMHTPIVNAIVEGDVTKAEDAMRAHMERAVRRLLASIADQSTD
ncbi:GntR family transcriptional repressor for pyruvate dehydrogenase complex [Kribbella sp. VKM Ac-2527]|uniref:GntR family transcriptional repressor for pyruvate dehydrogenase complex n=1 Tax=Kribbella caucasensis TaxID=2512215 RepID=A0A4R6KL61_9ACTN|nr:FadR/GntR family transcriptional regulator [Kribbella sp. VKM Ac-2527]TDO50526.1 GntR family transcriptional repressor for pyruvate dehydrogenase complex [Kribbella sp. VKM Ac-2527]